MNVIILAGMPATGKSTLAAKLQKKFGYPILEKDFISVVVDKCSFCSGENELVELLTVFVLENKYVILKLGELTCCVSALI